MVRAGWGLKLHEALKAKFESRPPPAAAPLTNSVPVKDVDQISEDDSMQQNPVQGARPTLVRSALGYRDECITVDARQDKKNEWVLLKGAHAFDFKQDPKTAPRENSLLDPYCLVITRRYNKGGEVQETILEIQSPQLIQVIRSLVTYYPDNTFRVGEKIKCETPSKLIYYHRGELEEHKSLASTDKRTKDHIGFLLNSLYSQFGKEIEQYEAFLALGMIKFADIWMMFKPGCYVYEHKTEQLYFLEKGEYRDGTGASAYDLDCYYVDYDGEKVGKVKRTLHIHKFANPRDISTLNVLPLSECPDPGALKQKLRTRAKRFLDLRGVHALQHAAKGRVMVDAKTFLSRIPPEKVDEGIVVYEESKCRCAVCRKEVDEKQVDYDHQVRQIKDDEMLLCSSAVLGFVLSSHKWIRMKVDDLSDIQWSSDAIDRLVLDKRQKRVLSSLISSPIFTDGYKGDVIGWKGRGLVMLLHGAPGTGKTLTAECVCESLKRPLYVVSGGDLGRTAVELENSLEEILELSKLWKAVVLIDEADVFLEARSPRDITRNSFVSTFLRRLEYFEGVLMLTTNRVEQFDEAFISRIHLALSYPDLEPWMRQAIWANALKRFPAEQLAIQLDKDLEEIAKVPLNGRVISYAVRTAKAIADEDATRLTMEHLWDVVGVQQKFNEHMQQKQIAAKREH